MAGKAGCGPDPPEIVAWKFDAFERTGDHRTARSQHEGFAARQADPFAAGGQDVIEGQIDGRGLHILFGKRIDSDKAVLNRAHDLMIDQQPGRARRRVRDPGGALFAEPFAQPVIRAVAGEAAELPGHRARNRLPAVDDIIDGLAGHAGRLADGNLIET